MSRGTKSLWISSSFGDFNVTTKSLDSQAQKSDTVLNTSSSDDQLWVNKHSPKATDDLAVNKKKVSELQEWISKSISLCATKGRRAPILLLTGGSGVGKSTALQLVAAELHVQVKEWTNQSVDAFTESTNLIGSHDMKDPYESQMSKFSSFLFRANRYSSLLMSDERDNMEQHIVLVEDFPNAVLRDAVHFHDILRQYRRHGLCPLVFIVSDHTGSNIERHLFPKSLQSELCIDSLHFNPVAPTVLTKLLSKIATQEAAHSKSLLRVPEQHILAAIVETNTGDVRASINALQFYCQNVSSNVIPVVKTGTGDRSKSRKSRVSTNQTEQLAECPDGKDAMLNLLHAVGKILHCKRADVTCDKEALPNHLINFQRNSLLIDPDDVLSKVFISGEHFISFLHQNYVDFHTSIDNILLAASYLSDCDYLTAEWATRSVLETYGQSVAMRGIMFSLSEYKSVGWKPVHKPQWFDVVKLSHKNNASSQDLFCCYHVPIIELQTLLLPYLSLTASQHQLSPSQTQFLRDVTQLQTKSFRQNVRLETMSESNCDVLEYVDTSGNGKATVKSMPTGDRSDSQLPEALDDELTIEEYDSDL